MQPRKWLVQAWDGHQWTLVCEATSKYAADRLVESVKNMRCYDRIRAVPADQQTEED